MQTLPSLFISHGAPSFALEPGVIGGKLRTLGQRLGPLEAGDHERLKSALERAPHARRAHPTPEHYWPLVLAAGAGQMSPATVIEGGMTYEVLCMDAFVFGKLPGR